MPPRPLTQEPFIVDDDTFYVLGAEHPDRVPFIIRSDTPVTFNGKASHQAVRLDIQDLRVREAVIARWIQVHGGPWPGAAVPRSATK